jgi:RHS repeat-associated protein
MHSLKLNKYDPVIHFATGQTLGVTVAVTNANGNIIARQSFDAWGRRRKVQDYSYLPQNTASTDNGLNNNGTLPQWLYRGYTGHEMLDEFTLINMNARLYDQVLGLFLSPDKFISDPNNTQSYNRYAYCLNNPLKYTDPSGNIASLIAARNFSEGVNWMNERMNGNKNYNYDHQFVMTGQMSNTWRNDPSIVRGPNGLPMGPNGELSAFGDYGISLEYSGNAGRKPFTDATGLNWRLQHQYIGEVKTRTLKDKDGKIIKDENGNMVSGFVETGNLVWIGASYQLVGEDPNAWGSDFRGLADAQSSGGGFRDALNSTGDVRNVVAIPAMLVDNAAQMTTKGFIASPPVPTTEMQAVKYINRLGTVANVAGKFLGVASITEHSTKVYDAYNRGDYGSVFLNSFKVGADIGTTFFMKATPVGIGVSIGYTIFDLYTGER